MKKKKKSAIDIICSVGELGNLFREGQNLRGFLQQVVSMIKNHMKTDVCSIYLFNDRSRQLILEAAEGFSSHMIGKFSLAMGEGLSGLVLEKLQPIREGAVLQNPSYKLIPGSSEEQYNSFLAVPILRGLNRVGVVTLQHKKSFYFTEDHTLTLRAIASQLATTLENAQLLIEVQKKYKPAALQPSEALIRGTPVVEGVALGRSYTLEEPSGEKLRIRICSDCYRTTMEDFRHALDQSTRQLEELQIELEEDLSDVASLIFSAHLLILRDSGFSGAMEELINEGEAPAKAVEIISNRYIDLFSVSENHRMREKMLDIKDLGHRILKNLSTEEGEVGDYRGQIIITDELLPSELLKLTAQKVEGLVLSGGGTTAHVAVLARSLRVPLIFTEDESLFKIKENTPLALDAYQGTLVVNPGHGVLDKLTGLKNQTENLDKLKTQNLPETRTLCGTQVKLRATINLLTELKVAKTLNADGVGLYRSEFPFLVRNDFPSEEEQYLIYRKVVTAMKDPMVTLRTLDVGGDKILGYLPDSQEEANPFLGLRGIRFLLRNEHVFISQVKAMIRAARGKKIRIMFPLVSSTDDFLEAREFVAKSIEALKNEGFSSPARPKLGLMVELPSAVELIPELAREADFLSLGTNDLVQYLLGVDRTNEKVASLFETRHPAVLRAAKKVVDAAREAQCPLTICGGMAEDPVTVYYFLGLGIREFSVAPTKIPLLQNAIASMEIKKAEEDARYLNTLGTIKSVKEKFAEVFSENKLLNNFSVPGESPPPVVHSQNPPQGVLAALQGKNS